MQIEVNLYASLARYKPLDTGTRSWLIQCREGTQIAALLDQLGIPPGEVKLIFRNGVYSGCETNLKHGDRIGLFPPIGGG